MGYIAMIPLFKKVFSNVRDMRNADSSDYDSKHY